MNEMRSLVQNEIHNMDRMSILSLKTYSCFQISKLEFNGEFMTFNFLFLFTLNLKLLLNLQANIDHYPAGLSHNSIRCFVFFIFILFFEKFLDISFNI